MLELAVGGDEDPVATGLLVAGIGRVCERGGLLAGPVEHLGQVRADRQGAERARAGHVQPTPDPSGGVVTRGSADCIISIDSKWL